MTYFDNPNDHLTYEGVNGLNILILGKTEKGKETIKLFDLDSVAMTKERYKDALVAKEKLPQNFEDLIKRTKTRSYSTS